jgi:hypothetical protein
MGGWLLDVEVVRDSLEFGTYKTCSGSQIRNTRKNIFIMVKFLLTTRVA